MKYIRFFELVSVFEAPYYAYVEMIEIGFSLDCLIFWSWAT